MDVPNLFKNNMVDNGTISQNTDTVGDEGINVPEGNVDSPAIEGEPAKIEQDLAKPKDDDFARRFASLSKKEKALRQKEQAMNKRMAELEERLKTFEAPKTEQKVEIPLDRRLRQDPLKVLEEVGMPYEKLTQLILNDGKLPADMQMQLMKEELDNKYKSEIDKLRQELAEKESKNRTEHEAQTISNFKAELAEFVSNSADYELIQANNAAPLVYDVIEAHFNETGRVLSNKEAADHVESHLLEEARKLLKLKKLGVPQPAAKPVAAQNKPTLTNSASSTISAPQNSKRMSNEESKLAAANLIKWKD